MDRTTAQELIEQFHDRAGQMFARVRHRLLAVEADRGPERSAERVSPADRALPEQTFPEPAVTGLIESQAQGPGFTASQEGGPLSDIEQKRAEVLHNFEQIAEKIAKRRNNVQRPLWERAEAEMKAKAAPLFPDQEDLQAYRTPTEGDYAGLVTTGVEPGHADRLRSAAEARLRRLAETHGLFPDMAVARYQGGPVPDILAEKWHQDEVNEVLENAQRDELEMDRVTAREQVERFHHEADEMLNRFRARVREVEAEREQPGYGISRADDYGISRDDDFGLL